jgi:hypothetical protein
MNSRRFPPPWTVEDIDAAFVVKDSTGQKLACVYYEDEPTLLAITARQYPSPNAQHHETPRIIQGVPPVESASSSEVIVAR